MKKDITIEELLSDESFVSWANGTDETAAGKWDTWIEIHPEHQSLVEEARLMARGIPFHDKEVAGEDVFRNWNRLAATINTQKDNRLRRRRWLQMAAAAAVFLLAGLGLTHYILQPESLEFHTAYGETKTVELPDGSRLALNANSSVRFLADWDGGAGRQVRLRGEGFFEVTPQPANEVFVVHTEGLKITVLGTVFNVNAKRKRPIVSLAEGVVKLQAEASGAELLLEPGQTAWLDEQGRAFQSDTRQTAYWCSWAGQKWAFGEGTPLKEVLERIRETYGLDYEVADPALLQRMASGDISIESREVLLDALSILLDLDLEIKNGVLFVSSSENG